MKKIIHVHQNHIRSNIKNEGELKPPIIVRTYKGSEHFFELDIKSPCKIRYQPHDPLNCGARLWIETEGDVEGRKEL